MLIHRVMVPANVYNGRNFDFRCTPVPVLASDEWSAIRNVNRNKDAVLEYLHEKKVQTGRTYRYLIPHREPPNKNVFFQNVYYVPQTMDHCLQYRVLCPDGKFHRVNLRTYKNGTFSLRVF